VAVGLQFFRRAGISYYLTARIYLKERGHTILMPGHFRNANKDKENIHSCRRDCHRRGHEYCGINCSSPERGRGGEHQQTRCHDHEFRVRHRCFFGVFCYRNPAARVYGTTSDTVSDRVLHRNESILGLRVRHQNLQGGTARRCWRAGVNQSRSSFFLFRSRACFGRRIASRTRCASSIFIFGCEFASTDPQRRFVKLSDELELWSRRSLPRHACEGRSTPSGPVQGSPW